MLSNSAFKATMAMMLILIVIGLFFLAVWKWGALMILYTLLGLLLVGGAVGLWLSLYEHYENK